MRIKRIDIVVTNRKQVDNVIITNSETKLSLLYNEDIIHEELVHDLIESGDYRYDERIVITTPKRADLLLSGK